MKKNNIEVIVVTMHQRDFSLVEKMNITTNAIIANQTDVNKYASVKTKYGTIKMISTTTRGVGLNRNIGLKYSKEDILLFTDDDFKYNSDMPEKVLLAFDELPEADVIIFGIDFSRNRIVYKTRCLKTGHLPFYKSLKFGTCAIAIRRNKLLTSNLSFIELFGGGCIYSHGEDSNFIMNCYKNRLRVYSYNYVLGCTAKDTSTCFEGYNEKYFYDTGALAKSTFGILAVPYMIYMVLRMSKLSNISAKNRRKYMIAGYINYNKLISYDEWVKSYGS